MATHLRSNHLFECLYAHVQAKNIPNYEAGNWQHERRRSFGTSAVLRNPGFDTTQSNSSVDGEYRSRNPQRRYEQKRLTRAGANSNSAGSTRCHELRQSPQQFPRTARYPRLPRTPIAAQIKRARRVK
jgi:uncharacterized Zn-finger protein